MIQFGGNPTKGILGALRDFSERHELVLDFPESGTLRLRLQPKAAKPLAAPKPEGKREERAV